MAAMRDVNRTPDAARPLRIGLVTGEYPPMEGGVGAYTQALAQALSALGHAVTIVSNREARPPDAPRQPALAYDPIDIGFAALIPRMRRANWRDVGLIADVAIRYELDIVNIQQQAAAYNMRNPAIYFAPWRLRGVARSVVTFHDLRVPYLFPKAGGLRKWVVGRMARSADSVIATNPADAAALAALRDGERVAEIPIGSNIAPRPVSAETVARVRTDLGLAPDQPLIGYFGFLNPSKGADTLIAALAQLDPRVHLLFIGGRTGSSDGNTNQAFFEQLDRQIADAGLTERVHWTGFVADAHVSAALHACDVMALPYRDGVSLRRGTLMAVLAHGRPLVTTRPDGDLSALAHGENGWLVERGDSAELATALRTLLADSALRARLGAAAAVTAQQFTWDAIAQQTVAHYRQTLSDLPPLLAA